MFRFRNRLAAIATCVGLLAGGLGLGTSAAATSAGVADTSGPPGPSTPPVADAQSAPSESTASVIATTYGHAVTVDADTTETEQVQAEANGSFQLTESSEPVRLQQNGAWVPVNTSLVAEPDGLWGSAASPVPVEFSAGGSGVLARVQGPSGDWVSLSWSQSALPSPTVSGSTATYVGVLPGVNLVLSATLQGMSEVLVVSSAAAAADPQLTSLQFSVSGAALSPTAVGSPTASSEGATVSNDLLSPAPSWWDSSQPGASSAAPGLYGSPQPVPDTVSSTIISIDASSVASTPGVVYPVYVDPDVTNNVLDYTYVDTLYPTTSYYNNTPFVHVGYITQQYAGDGNHVTRSFWTMNTANLEGTVVTAATFNAWDLWSFSCSARRVDLWQVSPIGPGTTWNVPPTLQVDLSNQTIAYQSPYFPGGNPNTTCPTPSQGTPFGATSAVQDAATNNWANITLGLLTNESDIYAWKQFSDNATLQVTYYHKLTATPTSLATNDCPFVCSPTAYVNSATPTLQATEAAEPDGLGMNLNFTVETSTGTVVSSGSGSVAAGGGIGHFTVPSGKLSNTGNYKFDVQACPTSGAPSSTCSPVSTWKAFQVDTSPPAAPVVAASGGLSTNSNSFSGYVGFTPETVTISAGNGDATRGFVYGIFPSGAGFVFPVNPPACGSSVNGYTTVCPTGPGVAATVTVTAPSDTSSFAAEAFDEAGNASLSSPSSTVSFYANGDSGPPATTSAQGDTWQTDQNFGPPGTCQSGTVPDLQATNALTLSAGACWTYDPGAPPDPVGNGVLSLANQQGQAEYASSASAALNTTKSFTVGALVNPASSTATGGVFSQDGSATSAFWLGQVGSYWEFCMPVSNSATAVETCAVSAAGAVVPGSWTYVAGVWEAADNELLLYVGVSPDGTPTVGTPTVASRSASLAWLSTSPLFVGRASIPTSGYEYFSGEILDPAAFQGVADTIQLDHAAGLTYPWVFGGSS